MKTVGSYEMKTHLAGYLKDVAAGESLIITLHGTPVAKLSPMGVPDREQRIKALDELKKLRSGRPHDSGELRRWIKEGRR